MTRHHSCRVSPFGHPRIHARLTAPRGISQPPTSFIGSQCQGIHHAPLNTYNTKPKNESPNPSHKRRSRDLSENLHYTEHTSPQRPACSDARNHYPQIKHHTPPPKQGNNSTSHPTQGPGNYGPVVSKPNSVSGNSSKQCSHTTSHVCCMHQTCLHYREQAIFTIRPRSPNSHTMRAGLILVVLLRKEVIQPHLPVRLPCYDFVPIADPTFDGSLHKG